MHTPNKYCSPREVTVKMDSLLGLLALLMVIVIARHFKGNYNPGLGYWALILRRRVTCFRFFFLSVCDSNIFVLLVILMQFLSREI